MPEYNAGDAKLRIVPDASNFKKDLEAKLKTIQVDYTVRVNVALAQAQRDMERFRAQQDNTSIGVKVNAQLSQARIELAKFRAEQRANDIDIPVNTKNAEEAGRRAKQSFLSEFTKLSSEIGSAFSGVFDIGKTIGITGLVANIPAAVTAVASLGQALGQLSGAALVVPGAIATAGASIGTLAVGLSGISDAYSAVAAAADESSTGQVERAAAATSATQGLRNAVVDEAQAQKDVAQARKDALTQLRDLNTELRSGQISEAQAINDAAKARRDLAKGGFKDALDAQDAQLRVAASDERVIEAHNRNIDVTQKKADADAKGVEGSDLVTAANERVVRSNQAVASAQQALTQALGTSNSAVDKATDAMAKLSPNAKDFVNTLVGLRGRWTDLRKEVSNPLFEGASASFTQFVDSVVPNLQSGMVTIAKAWNGNIKTLLASLGSGNSKGLLDRILGNTAQAQKNFDAAIDPLVRGIGTLTAAGSDAIPRLATAIGDVATRFSTFIEAADKDGRLDKWISAGLDGFTDLGNILLNIGKSFFSITDALGGGSGLLGGLQELTGRMATFLGSTEGQNKIRAFFQEGREEIAKLKPLIGDIIEAIPGIIQGVQTMWDAIRPPLQLFADFLKDNPRLIGLIAEAFVAAKLVNGITGLYNNIKKISDLLTGLPSKVGGIANSLPDGGGPGAAADPKKKGARPGKLGQLGSLLGPIGWGVAASTVTYDMTQDAVDRDVDIDAQVKAIDDALPPGIPKSGTPEASQMLTGFASQNEPGAQWVNAAPGGADGRVERAKRYAFWAAHYNPNDPVPFVPPEAGSYEVGGPTKAGLAVLHDQEFVLSNRASKYPMSFKHALNEGKIDPNMLPHFYNGGQYRTDMPPGAGPDPIAPNPAGGSGIFGALIQGIQAAQGPINNAIGAAGPAWSGVPGAAGVPAPNPGGVQVVPATPNPTRFRFAPSVTPGDTAAPAAAAAPAAGVPHLTGSTPGPDPALVPGAGSDAPVVDPAAATPASGGFTFPGPIGQIIAGLRGDRKQVWQNADGTALPTDQILAGLPDKLKPINIGAQFGQALLGGVLGFFGLENSILSPGNQWNQAIQQTLGLSGSDAGSLGGQTYDPSTVDDILANGAATGVIPGGQPYGLPAGSNSGGYGGAGVKFPDWVNQLGAAFGVKPSTYAGHQEKDGLNKGIDWSGPTANMQKFAEYVSSVPGMEQVIWDNPDTDQKIGIADGQRVGPGTAQSGYYNNDWADHRNHVHTRQSVSIPIPITGGEQMLAYAPKTGASAQAGAPLSGAPGNLKSAAYQAYIAAGMPPGEWSDFDQLIQHESSWKPTNKNPGSTAYGLGQFLDTTWATVGGAKTDDPMQQLQYIFSYLNQRPDYHGSPSAAWAAWQSRSPHWYDQGGLLPTGLTLAMNKTGKPERILNPEQNAHYEAMLPHFVNGGPFRAAVPIPPPPKPSFQGPKAQEIKPRIPTPPPAAPRPAPAAPAPPPGAVPAGPPAAQPPAATTPAEPQGLGPTEASPDTTGKHLLPAISTGIKSAAATAGAIAQTAASAASFGAAGAVGGGIAGGGGGGGPSIQGLFQLGGKAITGLAEVGASFLVGNVTAGTTPNAYGETYRPQQMTPQTAAIDPGRTYVFNGMDSRNVVDDLRLKDSQDAQATLARYP